jgi:nucleotide-binding universal stress UspA family protein
MTLLHLVGHDATERGDDALALARTIGAGRDVRRLVVHVIPLGGPTYPVSEEWLAAQATADSERLSRIRSSLQGDETLELVFADSAARGLHDRAEEHGADLVVVGARARHPLQPPLGTVAGRLLAGGPCAIAHAPAHYAATAGTLARIVVGFDGSEESHGALAQAAGLAAASGALIDVVCAHDPPSRMFGSPGAVSVTPAEPHEADRAAAELARDGLETLPEAVRGIAVARPGAAGAAIDAFAVERDADLVVLGSRGYGPILRALLGSTGAHMLHHLHRPVLVVPRGAQVTVPLEAHGFAIAP